MALVTFTAEGLLLLTAEEITAILPATVTRIQTETLSIEMKAGDLKDMKGVASVVPTANDPKSQAEPTEVVLLGRELFT